MTATKQTANSELEVHVSYSESCNHVYAKKGIYLGGSQKTIRELRKHVDSSLPPFFTTNWFMAFPSASAGGETEKRGKHVCKFKKLVY